MNFEQIGRGLLGIAVFVFISYLLSSGKKQISWKTVIASLLLQFLFAVAVLKIPGVIQAFNLLSSFFVKILDFSEAGATFLFGEALMDSRESWGYIFAFHVLPTIVFFSALSSLLYYLGVLQKIVYGLAWVLSRFIRLSGAESLSAAGNIFLGQTEAPLLVRPYLEKMTRSEILCVMIGGMANIAGGVLAAYVGFLGGDDPAERQAFATHLLAASLMSAPAAILVAKLMLPETEPEKINPHLHLSEEKVGSNVLDAVSKGTTSGVKLAVNVGAMLLVFTALMAMLNALFGWIGEMGGLNAQIAQSSDGRYEGLSLQYILGYIFSPVAWLVGVSSENMFLVGQMMGEKTILNEFFAYATLSEMKDSGVITNSRDILLSTYALCGFANFASIGIQIGGIGLLAPNQRVTLSELGIKALIGGTIATFMTAAMVGLII